MSLKKWKLVPTRFVEDWKTIFADEYVAPMFSHQNIGGCETLIPSYWSKDWILVVVSASALHSASVLDWATVAYFSNSMKLDSILRKYSIL